MISLHKTISASIAKTKICNSSPRPVTQKSVKSSDGDLIYIFNSPKHTSAANVNQSSICSFNFLLNRAVKRNVTATVAKVVRAMLTLISCHPRSFGPGEAVVAAEDMSKISILRRKLNESRTLMIWEIDILHWSRAKSKGYRADSFSLAWKRRMDRLSCWQILRNLRRQIFTVPWLSEDPTLQIAEWSVTVLNRCKLDDSRCFIDGTSISVSTEVSMIKRWPTQNLMLWEMIAFSWASAARKVGFQPIMWGMIAFVERIPRLYILRSKLWLRG